MNQKASRTEGWIDRRGRGVLLNHEECQPRRQNWSAPEAFKPTRIRLNYEPDARKSAH
jgi:hypothetical protein